MMECHHVAETSVRPLAATQQFMVDTHAHYHECFDVEQFFHVAIENATRCGNVTPCLMLADPADQNSLVEIAKRLSQLETEFEFAYEDDAAIVKRDECTALVLIRGRQIRTHENLEILAYGESASLSDGYPFRDTLQKVAISARIGIVPWSFGKWWGRRRHVLKHALNGLVEHATKQRSDNATIALGDNGCRPRSFQLGGSLRSVVAREMRVLPGSDPLPISSEVDRICGFGMLVEMPAPTMTCGNLRDRLLDAVADARIITVGRRVSLARLVRQQIELRCRAHAKP